MEKVECDECGRETTPAIKRFNFGLCNSCWEELVQGPDEPEVDWEED